MGTFQMTSTIKWLTVNLNLLNTPNIGINSYFKVAH
jgi:hypothetical protein